jgi:flagellar biosynthetic protein FlhB
MQDGAEQNKTEQATPFKLKRAKQKGVVARGVDLGFFSSLAAFVAFAAFSGATLLSQIALDTSRLYRDLGEIGSAPQALAAAAAPFWNAFQIVVALGGCIFVVVATLEIIQVGGLVFTTQPLKPDFSRLNPAKGLKRLFSARMLKETAKSVVKLCLYATASFLVIKEALALRAASITDAATLIDALHERAGHLSFVVLLLALVFAALDQVIARGEFAKQMRMSRSELTREHKEREGEPRLKQKRKQLHAEFASQTKGFGDLAGADMLVVNPEHYAVALVYDAKRMAAPKVLAKGRNHFALALKHRASALSIPILNHPPLARALFKACALGDEAPSKLYRDIANLYLALARARKSEPAHGDA